MFGLTKPPCPGCTRFFLFGPAVGTDVPHPGLFALVGGCFLRLGLCPLNHASDLGMEFGISLAVSGFPGHSLLCLYLLRFFVFPPGIAPPPPVPLRQITGFNLPARIQTQIDNIHQPGIIGHRNVEGSGIARPYVPVFPHGAFRGVKGAAGTGSRVGLRTPPHQGAGSVAGCPGVPSADGRND